MSESTSLATVVESCIYMGDGGRGLKNEELNLTEMFNSTTFEDELTKIQAYTQQQTNDICSVPPANFISYQLSIADYKPRTAEQFPKVVSFLF